MNTYSISYKVFRLSLILLLFGLAVSSCILIDKESETSDSKTDMFFSNFSEFDQGSANFRVGAETDTFMYHFKIKAMTTAYFDDIKYTPRTIYILKHHSGDSLVVKTSDTPLISHDNFRSFYENNREKLNADTIIDSNVFDKFYWTNHGDVVNVESFEDLPFLFLDVNFNGYPALLVRENVGQGFYYYKVYGISDTGYHQVNFEPYLSIKSRTNPWCFGGSTEFDYKNNTIKVFNLSNHSCSDYGTQIIDVYKLNTVTDKFDKTQITRNYDFN